MKKYGINLVNAVTHVVGDPCDRVTADMALLM